MVLYCPDLGTICGFSLILNFKDHTVINPMHSVPFMERQISAEILKKVMQKWVNGL